LPDFPNPPAACRREATVAAQSKEVIASLWLQRVLSSYPGQSADFLAKESDPFRNPVGSTIRRTIGILLDQVLLGVDRNCYAEPLDPLMQIWAVQGLAPSQVIGTLFQLKDILRPHVDRTDRELLDSRIDELALVAFDSYVKHRERTFQAKANEVRRRVSVVERRLAQSEAPDLQMRGGA